MATGIPLSYGGLVKHLFKVNRFSQVKMGLKNMQDMIRILQLPIEQLPVVHVAGTNGKGSVCWKVATALSAAGYKTGLFVSPHVSCFRERVRVDTVPITQEEVTTILTRLFHAAKENEVPVTFFEHVTLMALIHFLQQKVDVAVLEVGLGGRLDATNVVHPLLSVITSIGFDHMYVLGNTIESIALEKAGIMKSGVPVVIGPDTPVPVMLQAAKDKGAMPILVPPLEKRPSSPSSSSISPPPADSTLQAEVGSSKDYMAENNAIARVAMMELQRLGYNLNETSMEAGLKARPPCRFERFSLSFSTTKKPFTATSLFPVEAAVVSKVVEEAVAETKDEAKEETKEGERTIELVLDAGHNPAGLQSLGYLLQATYPPQNYRYHFVIALSSDKDPRKALSALFQVVAPPSSRLPPSLPQPPQWPPSSSLKALLSERCQPKH